MNIFLLLFSTRSKILTVRNYFSIPCLQMTSVVVWVCLLIAWWRSCPSLARTILPSRRAKNSTLRRGNANASWSLRRRRVVCSRAREPRRPPISSPGCETTRDSRCYDRKRPNSTKIIITGHIRKSLAENRAIKLALANNNLPRKVAPGTITTTTKRVPFLPKPSTEPRTKLLATRRRRSAKS